VEESRGRQEENGMGKETTGGGKRKRGVRETKKNKNKKTVSGWERISGAIKTIYDTSR